MQRDVQAYAQLLLNRRHKDSPFDPSTLASKQEIEQFEKAVDPDHCCDLANFRIDIWEGSQNKWNFSAATVFAEGFINTGVYKCNDSHLVEEAFLSHTRTLRKKYRNAGLSATRVQAQLKKDARANRKGTVGTILAHVDRAHILHQLFFRRREVCMSYPQLARHLEMLELLGKDGMSSDETDSDRVASGKKKYRIVKSKWRSDSVTQWLKGFDAVEAIMRTNGRGNVPRTRSISNKVNNESKVVPGLPRNAYDAFWYANVGEFTKAKTRRREEVYNFEHNELVKAYVPPSFFCHRLV
ncbi:hypothetical protein OH76DRAFT_1366956 [Lentinus brumalis]|uniref:Uncharacterized protein n=1 Tax=Lentinus brumalis TaxID=2498619 RepID=A0A371CI64_9APHY|nr:hypothetical protein OH76DRAFT_1366956 [Polyporus brumalis]